MFASIKKSPERLQVIDRVTQWTRERFKLPKEAVISVSEIACLLPGCPPLETVVVFWMAEHRYQFKLFKPVEEVVIEDLPYAWLKDALAIAEGIDCDCC
jgi:nitrate reductase delta subunit